MVGQLGWKIYFKKMTAGRSTILQEQHSLGLVRKYLPPGQRPPGQRPPLDRDLLWERVVRILLECILVL